MTIPQMMTMHNVMKQGTKITQEYRTASMIQDILITTSTATPETNCCMIPMKSYQNDDLLYADTQQQVELQ